MNNITFRKSLRLLAHPLSLAAIGLMLVNDFVLKPLAPSWLTGKLSDAAGLFFLPFVVAALLALFLPRRWVGWVAFGITSAGFALLKLDPGFNAAILGLGASLTGLPLQAHLDPSDLLALLSLLPAVWLWRRPASPLVPSIRWRLLVLPLAALVTLADAAAPNLGVACLSQSAASGAPVLATTVFFEETYQSQDGGLTWQAVSTGVSSACPDGGPTLDLPINLQNPADGTNYRIIPGQGIDRSEDKGVSWHSIYTFTPITEPDQAYFRLTRGSSADYRTPPFSAVFDSSSGNMIVAMGLDGVLVRRPSGDLTWAAVGPYQHDSLQQAGVSGLVTLLLYQAFLAILVGLGWLFTRSARLMPGRAPKVWTVLGWIGLGLTSLLVSPNVTTATYGVPATWIALGFMTIATLIALLVALINLKGRFFRMLPGGLLQGLLLAAACLIPYALWGTHILAAYTYAFIASTGLVVVLFVVFSLKKLEKNISNV